MSAPLSLLPGSLSRKGKAVTKKEPSGSQIEEEVGRLKSEGIEVKDLESGLVDFYGLEDGEVVFLCWQFGESRVVAWHSVDTGFSDRQPLPGAPNRWLN